MERIIDASVNLAAWGTNLRSAGVGTVIRYYARSSAKRLEPAEAKALTDAGLSLAVVFENRGGGGPTGPHIEDLTADTGQQDAQLALECAAAILQPKGSVIYFAVDSDFVSQSDLTSILDYFAAIKGVIAGQYRIGVYGSGLVAMAVQTAGLADYIWLSMSKGWTGYKACLASGRVNLLQLGGKSWPAPGFDYDEDVPGQGTTDIGAFIPGSAPAMVGPAPRGALLAVNARNGLNLRRGPGTEFDVVRTLTSGTLVHGQSQTGGWVLADSEGDGQGDGYLRAEFLTPVAGALATPAQIGKTPYDFAREELAKDVKEAPGSADNPRIVAYHASTVGGPSPDSVPWCSSFVNWCVEQAGQHGTRSKWALSWDEMHWGTDVTTTPQPGDIAVFERRWVENGINKLGGHVGFYVASDDNSVTVLGGNQGNRVSIANFPKASTNFKLRSIRRPLAL